MRALATIACGVVLGACSFASPGSAAPSAWLNWGNCSAPFTNLTQTFGGPGVYHEVVSASDFSGTVTGYVLKLVVQADNLYNFPSSPLPDAWRFDPAGCQAGHLAITPDHSGCNALAPAGAFSSVSASYVGQQLVISYAVTFPGYVPDPATTFVLADVAYDHALSVVGTPPTGCGGVDRQACFKILQATWLDSYSVAHAIGFETFTGLEWQPNVGLGCLGDLPVRGSSWGSLKTLYR